MLSDRTPARSRRLNEMNSLRDMGNFPPVVNAGATLNVLVTIAITAMVRYRYGSWALALPFWIALVLVLNLMPVIVLRMLGWRASAPMPLVEQMDFAGDQHRFADWVYLAASANMAFWIALSWCAYTLLPSPGTVGAMLVLAFVCTFAPVWLRWLSPGR